MDRSTPPNSTATPSDAPRQDALVVFLPSGRRGRFALGTPLLEAARSLGVYIESVCGGRAICGRCQVQPEFGVFAKHQITSTSAHLTTPSEAEKSYAAKRILAAGRRLSCSAKIQGDLVVDVPTDVAVNRQVVRKRAEVRHVERDIATRLCYVEVEPPSLDRPQGDFERLAAALRREWHIDDVRLDFHLLPNLQRTLRKGDWKVTAAVHDDAGRPLITALWPGFYNFALGVAVDVGSTTIAAHLVSLLSGRTLASAGTTNPQIRFGEDLMSRVSYVMMNPDGRPALTAAVREAINALIARTCGEAGVASDAILEAVVVGNPIMHHLLLGIDPTELGGAPFALAAAGSLSFPARDIGLALNGGARVYTLPCIAGHVGADAAGVLLAEGPSSPDEITLVVDVGTNAEIMLGTSLRLLAASSPTGPAFEGAEISSGQRAAPGAIERVRIDPHTLEPRIKVIGCDTWSDENGFSAGTDAFGVTGICGSGIVEAIGEMFLAGLITHDGVIDPKRSATTDRVVSDGRTSSYVIWRGAREIRVTQGDIRAIQLAKAALYAGCRLLMDRLGVNRVDRIKLAGAFGTFIDPKYALVIGLIPDCDLAKVSSVGNAAGTGARMALLSRRHRREIEALVARIEKVETAVEPRFQQHFVDAMAFPNRVDVFPNLERVIPLPPRPTDEPDGSRRRRRPRTPVQPG